MTRSTRIINGKRVPAYVGARPRLRQSDFDAGKVSRAYPYKEASNER